jgi:hypothetical protein
MRRYKTLSLIIPLLFLLGGCDWVRSTLGMPTSQDLDKLRYNAMMANAADSAAAKKDTVAITADSLAKGDTLASVPVQEKAGMNQPETATSARFYVIAGSFKEEANAAKMDGYLVKNGVKPVRLLFKNGYIVVASSAHENANEAYAAMRKLLELDFSPEDVWVYDTKQKLHKE